MINSERIVPVTATDLITLYSVILSMGSAELDPVDAFGTDGDFMVSAGPSNDGWIASEPVKVFDYTSAVTAFVLYFVPAYDYKGFTVEGEAVTPTGAVEPDGRTLYRAELLNGSIAIGKVGF